MYSILSYEGLVQYFEISVTDVINMKTVGIIGAGAAGLCALRHVLNTEGLTPLIWEQSRVIGGTWVYTDKIETDEFGLPLHSSMYKNLR